LTVPLSPLAPPDSLDQLEWQRRYVVLAKDERKLYFFNDTEVSFNDTEVNFDHGWSRICCAYCVRYALLHIRVFFVPLGNNLL